MVQPRIGDVEHSSRAALFGSDGTEWIAALIDALGHLQVDVVSGALPSGGATETTLASLLTELAYKLETGDLSLEAATKYLNVVVKTCALPTGAATQTTLALVKTAVEKIDDLQGALGSVATDILRVASKSGDKIFGFESIVEEAKSNTSLPAGAITLDGTAVSTGKIWKITTISYMYSGTAPTNLYITVPGLATEIVLQYTSPPTSGKWYNWAGEIWFQVGDFIRLVIENATLNDDAYLRYAGFQMNAP